MDKSTDFNRLIKRPLLVKEFLVIDMWGIEGPYSDGKWHKLVWEFANEWIQSHPEQETATLWSLVRPCEVFANGTSCYFTASTKLPSLFFDRLAELFLEQCGPHVEILEVDFELRFNKAEGWRAYLHFEDSKLWEPCDEGGWSEVS